MTSPTRSAEIRKIRAKGYAAAKAGKAYTVNPYPLWTADRTHWWRGFFTFAGWKVYRRMPR